MNSYLYKLYLSVKYRKKNYPVSPFSILKNLLESQWWPRDKVKSYQLDRLNELLLFSKNNVSYYSKILKDVKLPIESLEEFKNNVPKIKKSDIIDNRDDFRGLNYTDQYEHTTSGSSGDPLITYISGLADAHRKAAVLRFHNTWGIKESDKSVLIWRDSETPQKSTVAWLKDYMKRRLIVNVFSLNENSIKNYYDKIEKYKPKYIRGYKSGILELADLMELNNLRFKNFRMKLAIVTAEVLTDGERAFIEKVLECKVVNEFGSADAGFFAYECPKGSMHINEESVFMYANEDNSAIVTEFYNDSMPYINYLNDDAVIISEEQCECGRTSRIISEIVGRESGYALRTDGTKITQFIFMLIFHELYRYKIENSVKKFKVFQNKNSFKVQIVPLPDYGKNCEAYIEKRMQEELGEEIKIDFELVDSIERDKSGKLRYFTRET